MNGNASARPVQAGCGAMTAADGGLGDQPWIDHWPLSQFDEARSKFPALVDIEAARIKLARRFNSKPLPKAIEVDLAWQAHRRRHA